jgi:hypothetical protein
LYGAIDLRVIVLEEIVPTERYSLMFDPTQFIARRSQQDFELLNTKGRFEWDRETDGGYLSVHITSAAVEYLRAHHRIDVPTEIHERTAGSASVCETAVAILAEMLRKA